MKHGMIWSFFVLKSNTIPINWMISVSNILKEICFSVFLSPFVIFLFPLIFIIHIFPRNSTALYLEIIFHLFFHSHNLQTSRGVILSQWVYDQVRLELGSNILIYAWHCFFQVHRPEWYTKLQTRYHIIDFHISVTV